MGARAELTHALRLYCREQLLILLGVLSLIFYSNRLEAFVYKEGFARLSTHRYEKGDIDNRFIHITNSRQVLKAASSISDSSSVPSTSTPVHPFVWTGDVYVARFVRRFNRVKKVVLCILQRTPSTFLTVIYREDPH